MNLQRVVPLLSQCMWGWVRRGQPRVTVSTAGTWVQHGIIKPSHGGLHMVHSCGLSVVLFYPPALIRDIFLCPPLPTRVQIHQALLTTYSRALCGVVGAERRVPWRRSRRSADPLQHFNQGPRDWRFQSKERGSAKRKRPGSRDRGDLNRDGPGSAACPRTRLCYLPQEIHSAFL